MLLLLRLRLLLLEGRGPVMERLLERLRRRRLLLLDVMRRRGLS